uniref:59 kDa protein n=1 Tax=Zhangzhou Fusar tick virus 1 TaxID=2972101 RepID=A0A9E7V1U0_9VIRU|nr:MAG: 59 kDa protein [Zhangzhou Fusar tick virus 1]
MDSNKGQSRSASQTPPPGSYPESTKVDSPPSVVSTSVQVKNEVKSILDEAKFAPVSYQGNSCWVIPKDNWKIVEAKLLKLQGDTGTTVPVSELAELQRELAMLRLQANDFKTQNERMQYAEKTLTEALARAKKNEELAKQEASVTIQKLAATQIELKASLREAQSNKKDYEAAIANAKKAGEAEVVEKLSGDKRRLSEDITSLNNMLQQVNADRKAEHDKLKRFELQVIELNNELQLERSKHAIASNEPGTSFAEKAKAMGTAPVKLFNSAASNLPQSALKRLSHVMDDPLSDEKNTLFWFKAALDSTKHAVYRPYKVVINGLVEDIKCFSPESRKCFDPFILKVRDSLLPTGQPLNEEDLNEPLQQVNQSDLRLNKAYQKKGFKTLSDLRDFGLSLGKPDASDLDYILHKGKLTRISGTSKGKGPIRMVDHEQEGDNGSDCSEPAPLTPDDLDESVPSARELWNKAKDWFLLKFEYLRPRVRRSLWTKPKRLMTYFKLANGNMFQRMLAVPYTWFIYVFP